MRKGLFLATLAGVCVGALNAVLLYREAERKNAPFTEQGGAQENSEIPTDAPKAVEATEQGVPLGDEDAGSDLCYYLPHSKIWHSNDSCAFILGKPNVVTSTVADAAQAGKLRGCTRCGA